MLQFEQCIGAGPAKVAGANPPGQLLRIFLVGIATVHGICQTEDSLKPFSEFAVCRDVR